MSTLGRATFVFWGLALLSSVTIGAWGSWTTMPATWHLMICFTAGVVGAAWASER